MAEEGTQFNLERLTLIIWVVVSIIVLILITIGIIYLPKIIE